MEQIGCLYSGNAWYQAQFAGPNGHLWRTARKLFLFNLELSSALNLFKFNLETLKQMSTPEGVIDGGARQDYSENERRPGATWTDDAKNSVRILLDRIVTRWRPAYLRQPQTNIQVLHRSLTPTPLQFVRKTYDNSNKSVEDFDVDAALESYMACLVPLQYHELWNEVVNDVKDVDRPREELETTIQYELFRSQMTLDGTEETALIFGSNRVHFTDSYKHLTNKLGLFDIVLVIINHIDYFGMVVYVEQKKVKVSNENKNSPSDTDQNRLQADLYTKIGIYVSQKCLDAFQQESKMTKTDRLNIVKLSNITSSRRMISAIHSFSEWPQYRSLLKPTTENIYFKRPEDFVSPTEDDMTLFNETQLKTIGIAQWMFDDLYDRLHIVHGPPGTGKSRTIAGIVLKLLPELTKRKQKILLCAPSNNACDELSRRILDQFRTQDERYKFGTLVRIGCQPPDDHRLCEHFLDFMILKELVRLLENNPYLNPKEARDTETRIMKEAKILVSTLNYCASSRMNSLKRKVGFIIVDEASQSLEADFLLPLRFGCSKVMVVGDPLQLPPCVLSNAGKLYGLSQSLYARLYSIFENWPNGPISMLEIQYRMHPEICAFPSNHFYHDRLVTHASVVERMRNFTLKPIFLYNMTRSRQDIDKASSSFNKDEASFMQYMCNLLIAHLVQELVRENDDNESTSTSSDDSEDEKSVLSIPLNDPRSIQIQQRIGVITPYKAQLRILRSYLPRYIEVMTVDSAQGKEKDLVLISCVRSGDTIGFLDDIKRLNVMLTRSKYALYMVGNFTQLATQHESWEALVRDARTRGILVDVDTNRPSLPLRSFGLYG